jgi:glycosyltransferase involved in cell wall biosynthesis
MGGSEYQTLVTSLGLATLGHEVAFLATDSSRQAMFSADGMQVLQVPSARVAGRGLHDRLLDEALEEAQPDVCYVRVFEEMATIVPLCRRLGVPTLSVSASAKAASPFLVGYHVEETLAHLRSLEFARHLRSFRSIGSSAVHVCNTRLLQRRVQRWFPGKRIRMIYNGSPVPLAQEVHVGSSGRAIWVNNLKRWKRPELFVRLARCLPQFDFVMIGQIQAGARYRAKINSMLAGAPSNLQYLGALPIDQVNRMISYSDLLLYTSLPVEGFGNSFLQAWLRGVPTVSLSYELDGILEGEGVGRCSASFRQLVADVEELMTNESLRRDMGERAREYAVTHHSAEKMVGQYEELLMQIAA